MEISKVGYSVFNHDKSIESKTEGKSRIYLRIKSAFTYDIWMDQSRTHKFDPARVLTYFASSPIAKWTRKIYFYSRFDKREVSRTHTNIHLFSKYIREHRRDSKFQVPNTDIFIDDNTFHLIECIIMSCIDIFISKDSSRDDRSYRDILRSEYEVLHAGSLCCKDISLSLKPKSILHIASWMIFWDIYRIEIQILCRHLHRFIYIESHSYKGILDFSSYSGYWVDASIILDERNSSICPFFGQS